MTTRIHIFTLPNCFYCDVAKTYMNENNIEYEEHKIGEDVTREYVRALFPGIKTAPVIQIFEDENMIYGDSNLIKEWNEGKERVAEAAN